MRFSSMRFLGLTCLSLSLATNAAAAPARKASKMTPPAVQADQPYSDAYRIAAVVEDEVITMLDVEERMKLVFGTTGLSNTPETRKQIFPRVIRTLVEERLQVQEAARNNLTVSDREIATAITSIERQRGKAPGSLKSFLASKNIAEAAFEDQLRAQIAWNKLIMRKVRPRIKIGNADIARELERRSSQTAAAGEVQLSTILLPVDTPESEPATKALAERLLGEIKSGASFEAVASQLGNQAQNASGIWANVRDLDPAVAEQVAGLQVGGISPVIRTLAGYQILRLQNRRDAVDANVAADAELLLKQILMTLKSDAKAQEVDTLLGIAQEVAKNPGSCAEKTVAGLGDLGDVNFEVKMVRTKLSSLSPELRPFVQELNVGDVSKPFATKEGIRLLMLCEKTGMSSVDKAGREKVRQELLASRLELEALKYMRNLKREAFIEIRASGAR